jgi:hypothetical protein
MAGITKTKIITAAIGLGWATVGANVLHWLGRPMSLPPLVLALSALIVGSLLVGQVWIQRGPGYYRAMRFGETVGQEKERRRREPASTPPAQRLGATAG